MDSWLELGRKGGGDQFMNTKGNDVVMGYQFYCRFEPRIRTEFVDGLRRGLYIILYSSITVWHRNNIHIWRGTLNNSTEG